MPVTSERNAVSVIRYPLERIPREKSLAHAKREIRARKSVRAVYTTDAYTG